MLAPWREYGSLGNLQAGLATNKLFNTGLLNVTQIASEVTDKCRYSLLRTFSREQVDAELRELYLISSIVPECKLNVVLVKYNILSDALLWRTNSISLTACLTPVPPSLSVSFFLSYPLPQYISNRVELFQCITLQSQSWGWACSPNPSLPDYEGSFLL